MCFLTGVLVAQYGDGAQGLYGHSAQGLGDRDRTQIMHRTTQCMEPVLQGLCTDGAQGLSNSVHSSTADQCHLEPDTLSCEILAAAVLLAGCCDVATSERLRPPDKMHSQIPRTDVQECQMTIKCGSWCQLPSHRMSNM